MTERDGTLSEKPLSDTGPTPAPVDTRADRKAADHAAFYAAWEKLLGWLLEYAAEHPHAMFEKEADFPDYIYRMERPYDLPTTIMSASLSDLKGRPVLLVDASPRHTVFKEIGLHPFESHTYRTLTYNADKGTLVEGKRIFTREMLFKLADTLYSSDSEPAE